MLEQLGLWSSSTWDGDGVKNKEMCENLGTVEEK